MLTPPSDSALVSSLVAKLISPSDAAFESGLNEAVSLVKRAEDAGQRAIRKAIITLADQPGFMSYEPGTFMAVGSDFSEARAELLALAARREFLKDPYKTQQLIAAFKVLNSGDEFARLVADVRQAGGSAEARALLLLNIDMWCYVQLSQKSGRTHEADPTPATTILGAAQRGQVDVARRLVQGGADVGQADRDGRRPLYYAAENGHIEVVRLLVELGADLNAVDNYEQSALYAASSRLVTEAINAPRRAEWTEMQDREPGGHAAVIEFLINRGADVNRTKKGHYKPAELIRDSGVPRLIALLRGREKARFSWSRLVGGG